VLVALCWSVLFAALRWPEIEGVELVPAPLELVRARAPQLITSGATLDFRTLTPERGGLFDYRVFGPGTVIDVPLLIDDAPAGSAAAPRALTEGIASDDIRAAERRLGALLAAAREGRPERSLARTEPREPPVATQPRRLTVEDDLFEDAPLILDSLKGGRR